MSNIDFHSCYDLNKLDILAKSTFKIVKIILSFQCLMFISAKCTTNYLLVKFSYFLHSVVLGTNLPKWAQMNYDTNHGRLCH